MLQASYDELDPEEAASDVGAGEDEGGSEGDLTRFERDRIRARIAEEKLFLEVIDAAKERTKDKNWKTCTKCGNPIGDARLEALPATDLCVTCKADRGQLVTEPVPGDRALPCRCGAATWSTTSSSPAVVVEIDATMDRPGPGRAPGRAPRGAPRASALGFAVRRDHRRPRRLDRRPAGPRHGVAGAGRRRRRDRRDRSRATPTPTPGDRLRSGRRSGALDGAGPPRPAASWPGPTAGRCPWWSTSTATSWPRWPLRPPTARAARARRGRRLSGRRGPGRRGGLARLDLTGADALEGGERAARVLGDPHVDHGHRVNFAGRRRQVAAHRRDAGDPGRHRVVGEAEVVVDVPLGELAAESGHVVERAPVGSMNMADTSFLAPSAAARRPATRDGRDRGRGRRRCRPS